MGIAGRGIRSGRGAETVLGAFGVDLTFSAFGASALCCDDLLGGVQLRVVAGGEGVTFTGRVGAGALDLGAGVGFSLAGAGGFGAGVLLNGLGLLDSCSRVTAVMFGGALGGGDGGSGVGGGLCLVCGVLVTGGGQVSEGGGCPGGLLGCVLFRGVQVPAGGFERFGCGLGFVGLLRGLRAGDLRGRFGAVPGGFCVGELDADSRGVGLPGLGGRLAGQGGGLGEQHLQVGEGIGVLRGGGLRVGGPGGVGVLAGAVVAAEHPRPATVAGGQVVAAAGTLAASLLVIGLTGGYRRGPFCSFPQDGK